MSLNSPSSWRNSKRRGNNNSEPESSPKRFHQSGIRSRNGVLICLFGLLFFFYLAEPHRNPFSYQAPGQDLQEDHQSTYHGKGNDFQEAADRDAEDPDRHTGHKETSNNRSADGVFRQKGRYDGTFDRIDALGEGQDHQDDPDRSEADNECTILIEFHLRQHPFAEDGSFLARIAGPDGAEEERFYSHSRRTCAYALDQSSDDQSLLRHAINTPCFIGQDLGGDQNRIVPKVQ